MLDTDAFLTPLYAMIDDFDKTQLLPEVQPGPAASLSRSEVLTLAVFSQGRRRCLARGGTLPVSVTSAAGLSVICARLFPLCPSAASSTACCATTTVLR